MADSVRDCQRGYYGYDRVSNVKAITDAANSGQVQTFGYDARDRLIQAQTTLTGTGQYTQSFGYDLMGNGMWKTVWPRMPDWSD